MNPEREDPESLEPPGGEPALDPQGGRTLFAYAPTAPPAGPLPAADRETLEQVWKTAIQDAETLASGDPGATVRSALAAGTEGVIVRPRPDRTSLRRRAPPGKEDPGPALPEEPGYHLLEQIGEGGMGVVWRGFQGALLRDVAIKQVKPSRGALDQFTGEALVTGFLDHPNIVPVHTLGQDEEGQLFLAMKLVQGTSWKDLLHPATDAHRVRAAAHDLAGHLRLLLSVCNAVAFAHSRMILHRDLKPENVMVGDFGEVFVMDWGIAVDMAGPGDAPRRTRHKSSVADPSGTPAYMAPEMAMGEGDAFGPWTDVYLLGAILHEILTGTPPHRGETVINVLIAAERSDPPRFPDTVPRELADICRRALARDPAERTPDVAAFRRALEDYLEHRESLLLSEKADRELEALLAPALPAGEDAYGRFAEVLSRYRQALEMWSGNDKARAGVTRAAFAYARAALDGGDLGLAEAQSAGLPDDEAGRTLKQRVAMARREALRKARHARQLRRALAASLAVIILGLAVGALLIRREQVRTAVERDRAVAAGREAEEARVLEKRARQDAEAAAALARKSQARAKRELYATRVHQVQSALQRDDTAQARRLLALCDESLRGWEWGHLAREADGSLLTLHGHRTAVGSLAVDPSGTRILSGCSGGLLKLWDGATGRNLRTWKGFGNEPLALAFSPDGGRVLAAFRDTTVRVLDAATGALLGNFRAGSDAASSAAFGPGGRSVAFEARIEGVTVWGADCFDVATGSRTARYERHDNPVYEIAFDAGGGRAATASLDRSVRLWDARTGEALGVLRGHENYVRAVALSQDGSTVVSGSDDRTVRVWDAATGAVRHVLAGHRGPVNAVAVSPLAGVAASGSDDGLVRLWDLATGRSLGVLRGHRSAVWALTFTPDGSRLVSGAGDGEAKIWALEAPRAVLGRVWTGGTDSKTAFSPDGDVAAFLTGPGTARVVDARGGGIAALEGLPPTARCLAVSRGGTLLAVGTEGGTIALWDAAAGRPLRSWTACTRDVDGLSFSGDGRRLASGGQDGRVVVWDVATGEERASFTGHRGFVTSVAFDPGGAFLASGGSDGTVRLWDPGDPNAAPRILRGHNAWVSRVAVGGAGRQRVVSRDSGGNVKVWDAEGGMELLTLELPGLLAGFTREGLGLAVVNRDRELVVLEAAILAPPPDGLEAFGAALEAGRPTEAAALLAANRALAGARLDDGSTALHMAAWAGETAVVRACLEAGAAVDARDHGGSSPLHRAVQAERRRVVVLLLDAGAAPDGRDDRDETPLHLAVRNGDAETTSVLLEGGAPPDAADSTGERPLQIAVREEDLPLARLLLDRGADAGSPGKGGATPLHDAAHVANRAILTLLLDRGANVNAADAEGRRPLLEALLSASNLRAEAAALLMDRGADVKAADADGATALHVAAARGDTGVLKLLLDRGAAVNARDRYGSTPLGEALGYHQEEAAALLRSRGGEE